MLLRFRFRNHRSFRDEQELSMVANKYSDPEGVVRHFKKISEGVLPVAAVYGANASGKSNLLKALDYFQDAVLDSHRQWKPDGGVPRDPFLGGHASDAASEYAIDFLLGETRYQFGFSADSKVIKKEWLYAFPSRRRQVWYQRKAGAKIGFGSMMPGAKRSIETLTRPNSLFLSAAVQNANEALEPIYKWLTSSLSFAGLSPVPRGALHNLLSRHIQQHKDLEVALLPLVKGADLGIEQIRVVEETMPPEAAEIMGSIVNAIRRARPEEDVPDLPSSQAELRFVHRGGHEFRSEQESNGTLSYFALLSQVLRALGAGGTLCVDELDSSLHPLLALRIVRLFQSKAINPRGAQLIFNTHDTNILSHAGLRRDQIWFCEKAGDGATTIYPLSDFKPRKEENLEAGYLQGRYGAIPFLNEGAFAEALGGADAKA
mgnify:CR=1 FL=1